MLEDNPEHFECLKRSVKDDQVSWVLRLKSDKAVNFVRQLNDQTLAVARFLDEDDTALTKVNLQANTRDIFKGQNVRLTLTLPPPNVMQATARVPLEFERRYNYSPEFPLSRKGEQANR
jgi:hypothetical protein